MLRQYVTDHNVRVSSLPTYHSGDPVSVVLICHNKANCLPYVVAALATNTHRPDLILLSDDGSSDGSQDLFLKLCASKGLESKILEHPPSPTSFRINTLRNDGIRSSLDGLVLILDADLVVSGTAIEAHVNMHLRHETGVLSTGPRLEYAYADCSGPVNFMWGHECVAHLQMSAKEPILTWTSVLGSNTGMTKKAFLSLDGYDPIYDGNYGYDDVDFTYRVSNAGYFFSAAFEAYVIHIPHPKVFCEPNTINHDKFVSKFGIELSQPDIYAALGRKAWAEYFQELLQDPAKAKNDTAIPVVNTSPDLDSMSGRVLLRAVGKKIVRRIGKSLYK